MLLGVAILFLPFVVAAEAVNPVYTWWLCKISSQTAFTNITFWRKIGSNRLFTSGIFLLLIIRAVVTVAGLTTIRSYGREEKWKKFYTVNDELSVHFMLFREGQKLPATHSNDS
ncbi:hypothetical protein BLNAU_19760 [Blattamonas nauphoetae]|uniref:Uncharacterized protein n=1 Tax=Blattamonas nauphoetae TaxID=2049346 RepID=A0ABQ9X0L0_9EUKA|nr:hypothetical protein BLNAU_19760 [Blattamonas nauphoetae]